MTESAASLLWLALLRVPGLGPKRINPLLDTFGTPEAIFKASYAQLREAGLSDAMADAVQAADTAAGEADLAWMAESGCRLISRLDDDYPSQLADIHDAPPCLFVRGNVEALAGPQLAIVGSRHGTRGGCEIAEEFATHLARAGAVITSGLARGIDAAAHRGALLGQGGTVGVMATGPDRIYPSEHRELARQILDQGGALVTEFPPGTQARAGHFPRRNRIISGLSLGVLVVEASLRSGSLITARYGLEQGREVFAIPGSIHNPQSKGPHHLIRQGAKLVETVEDVIEELGWTPSELTRTETAGGGETPANGLDDDYLALLEAVDDAPTPAELIVTRTGLTPEAVSSMLLVLELEGHVVAESGGRYARAGKRT